MESVGIVERALVPLGLRGGGNWREMFVDYRAGVVPLRLRGGENIVIINDLTDAGWCP